MIFTDRIHIITDDPTLRELHKFAKLLGLHICWFDSNPRHPHYDFPKRSSGGFTRSELIDNAFTLGAVEVTSRQIVQILKEV